MDTGFPLAAIAEATDWLDLPAEAAASVRDGADKLRHDAAGLAAWMSLHERWIASGHEHIEEARQWPAATGPDAAMAYALLCLSGVPRGRDRLERRGLPADVVRDSFADVPRRMARCHRAIGCWGVQKPRWLGRHVHGRLIELGRLQYEPGVMAAKLDTQRDPAVCDALTRHGYTMQTPVWWVHIPAGDPLTPAACDASFAEARRLLPEHFPDHPAKLFACHSWMLDGQLGDYLPAEANLTRFRRYFDVIHRHDDDADFRQFVYDDRPPGPPTRLQLADVEHKRRGGVWRVCLGVAPLS